MKFFSKYGDLFKTALIAIALIITAFWITSRFAKPAPPDTVTISTGGKNGAYYHYAQRYKEILKRNKITVNIVESSGSLENIQRLQEGKVDIAFVQGGTSSDQPDANPDNPLLSLGSLYYEPIWIFLANTFNPETLADFKQRKLAIGVEGSGTQMVTKQLLELNEIKPTNSQFVALSDKQSVKALIDGSIDAGFFVTSPDSAQIKELLNEKSVHLFSLKHALAYSRLLPFLSEVTLASGIIRPAQNFPTENINLLAPTSNLVIHKDLHPGVTVLILQAAQEIHSEASLFSPPNAFPATVNLVYPLSDVADRYYKTGPPFLLRYLPFWAAVMIDRFIVFLVPLLAVLFPLFKLMPPLYRWRVRSRIYKWYDELQETDSAISRDRQLTEEQIRELHEQLDRIENEVEKVKTPLSYADQLYQLMSHTELVRKRLLTKQQLD